MHHDPNPGREFFGDDPLAALDAELTGGRAQSDEEAMATFLAATLVCNMLGAKALLEQYIEAHRGDDEYDLFADMAPPEFQERVHDELFRTRLIDKYEAHGQAIAAELVSWLRAKDLGELNLFIPLPIPGLGIVVHRVTVNGDNGDIVLPAYRH